MDVADITFAVTAVNTGDPTTPTIVLNTVDAVYVLDPGATNTLDRPRLVLVVAAPVGDVHCSPASFFTNIPTSVLLKNLAMSLTFVPSFDTAKNAGNATLSATIP